MAHASSANQLILWIRARRNAAVLNNSLSIKDSASYAANSYQIAKFARAQIDANRVSHPNMKSYQTSASTNAQKTTHIV